MLSALLVQPSFSNLDSCFLMANDVAYFLEGIPSAQSIKVHTRMCSILSNLVIRVSNILPEIEAARPGCTSGIEALCLLNYGIAKAMSLLQYCSESSILYLALNGDAILSKCKRSRDLLEQSLNQIQNMVPITLAAKISGIIADVRSAAFCLDPSDEEIGKLLVELLYRQGSMIDSTEEVALASFELVSCRLNITSQEAVSMEKRSIRNLLNKFGKSEPIKRNILLFFLYFLNKYCRKLRKEELKENHSGECEHHFALASSHNLSGEVEFQV